MSERLSEEEREVVISEVGAVARRFAVNRSTMAGPSVWSLTLAQLPEIIEASVYPVIEAVLAARLTDQAARLAAVEALLRKFHIAGDLTDAQVNDFLAALHPDPSEVRT